MIGRKWLGARTTLAWALVKHVVLSLVWRKQGSAQVWLERLETESLTRTPEALWEHVAETSRCIGCGMCEVVAATGEHPSAWLSGAARKPEDADLAIDAATKLEGLAGAVSRICPAGVSPKAVASFIRAHAALLDARKK